jgi:Protein of unknown function (DUF3089)
MTHVARLSKLIALGALGAALAGCGGSSSSAPATSTSAVVTARDQWGTTWLCRPGLAANPCATSLTTTVFGAKHGSHVVRYSRPSNPPVDCFYVYPTVSSEPTVNADLEVGFNEREVAVTQASRFSQVCRVYAPVYRQITLAALEHPARITRADALIAYGGVLAAFRDYLAHYNHGRGIVFIGHSQGATILIKLLQDEVDRNPALRRKLVSAVLLGGNVTVKRGSTTGGDFAHLPACAAANQTGCVIAYSSYTRKPPANSDFGRTTSDAGVALLARHSQSQDLQIMCVNPAALDGSKGSLDPYFPALVLSLLPGARTPTVSTPWLALPGEETGRCESSGNATWLQVSPVAGSRLPLRHVRSSVLGLHVLDVNIALGNLVRLVKDESQAYSRR